MADAPKEQPCRLCAALTSFFEVDGPICEPCLRAVQMVPSLACGCADGQTCADCDPDGRVYPPAPPDPEGKSPLERWLA